MALTNLSQITTSGISTLADINLNNITGVAATFTGNVTVGGTLTYDDVTNVDSVGLVTARSGINITGGDLTLPDAIIHSGDTNTKIRFPAADTFSVETAGEERFRVTSGGLVGIGTDNPGAKLQIKETGGSTIAGLFETNQTDSYISFQASGTTASSTVRIGAIADNFVAFVNGGERLRIKSNGNVGIGTDNPGAKLQVQGTIRATTNVDVPSGDISCGGNAASGSESGIRMRSAGFIHASRSSGFIWKGYTTGTSDPTSQIGSNGDAHFLGSIGIGTDNPQGKLVVSDGANGLEFNPNSNNAVVSYNRSTSAYAPIGLQGSTVQLRIGGVGTALHVHSDGSLITGSGGVSESIGGGPNAIQSNNGISILRRTNDVSGCYLNLAKSRNTTAGQSTIIQNNDIVGSIGFCGDDGVDLNSPLAYINGVVDGTPAANSIPGALSFRTVASGTVSTERLRITSGGHIGIDCAPNDHNNFTRALDINGPSGAAVYMRTNDSTSNCFIVGNYGSEAYINNVANGNIRFFTSGTEKFRISNTGLVGVGTIDPDLRLHVNGVNALPSSSGSTATGHLTLRAKASSSSHGMFMGVSNAAPWSSWIQAQDASNNATNYPLLLNPNGGNIGIGVATPNEELHIHASGTSYIRFTDEASGTGGTDGAIFGLDHPHLYAWNYEAGDFVVATNATEKLRITSDGDVGIGDAAPNNNYGTNLSVHSTATDGARLKISDGTTGKGNLDGLDIISTGGVAYFINRENADMSFSNQGGERLRITAAGKVLIGSNTGSVHGDRLLQVGKTDRSSTYVSITSSTSGVGGLLFADTTTNDTGGYRGIIDYTHSTDAMRFYTQATERLRIDSGGNVSITNTPTTNSSKLFIRANSGADAGKWSHSCLALYNTTLVGEYSQIGLGYTLGTWSPSYFGFVSTNQASYGYGDLVFGTRGVSTDSQPTERLRITSGGLVATPASSAGASNVNRGYYHGAGTAQSVGMTMKTLGYGSGTGGFDTAVSVNAGNSGAVALLFATRNTSNGTSTNGGIYVAHFYYDGNNLPAVTFLGGSNWVTWSKSAGNTLQANWSGNSNFTFSMMMCQ